MSEDLLLDHFARLVGPPGHEPDLSLASLEVAAIGNSFLDREAVAGSLAALAARANERGGGADGLLDLFRQEGFRGNVEDFHDPRNSFLDQVLERRCGIPISLAVVLLDLAGRLGIPAHGVSFPGHFLVGFPEGGKVRHADPFEIRFLSDADLVDFAERWGGRRGGPLADWLRPATPRRILLRMLGNLAHVYFRRRENGMRLAVLRRMALLDPEDERIRVELEGVELSLRDRGSEPLVH
jgi:regulator of sirC expression with transglutaminase-like and TPR domain